MIYSSWQESTLAGSLNQVVDEFPGVDFGSYPKIGHPEYRVKVTIESKDEEKARGAFERLLSLLTQEGVVRTE